MSLSNPRFGSFEKVCGRKNRHFWFRRWSLGFRRYGEDETWKMVNIRCYIKELGVQFCIECAPLIVYILRSFSEWWYDNERGNRLKIIMMNNLKKRQLQVPIPIFASFNLHCYYFKIFDILSVLSDDLGENKHCQSIVKTAQQQHLFLGSGCHEHTIW